ncbi:MAG: hypothetical protein QWI73_06875 [Alphaproteobacteria bacterium]|nr:hypothetical protein [Alphaproteobacteria bacterium]
MNPKLLLIFLASAATSIFSPKANVALAADGDDQQCGPGVTKYVARELSFDKELLFENALRVTVQGRERLFSRDVFSSFGDEAHWSIDYAAPTDYTIMTKEFGLYQLVLSCSGINTTAPITENCTIGYLNAEDIQHNEQRFRLTVYKGQWKNSEYGHNRHVFFSVNSIKWPERCLSK